MGLSAAQVELVQTKLLSQETTSNILHTLEDLDKASLRAPALLRYFVQDLLHLVHTNTVEVRHATFALLARYLHYAPRESGTVVRAIILCMESQDESMKHTAIQYAAEFFPYTKEHSSYMLLQLFKLGKIAAPHIQQIIGSCVENARFMRQ